MSMRDLDLPAEAFAAPEPCSCEQALSLRDELVSLRQCAVYAKRTKGYWTVELWLCGELLGAYVNEPRLQSAIDHASEFIRRIELQANVAGNGEQR